MVSEFYLSRGFPQCLSVVDESYVNIKKTKTIANDYMNQKGQSLFDVQAAAY